MRFGSTVAIAGSYITVLCWFRGHSVGDLVCNYLWRCLWNTSCFWSVFVTGCSQTGTKIFSFTLPEGAFCTNMDSDCSFHWQRMMELLQRLQTANAKYCRYLRFCSVAYKERSIRWSKYHPKYHPIFATLETTGISNHPCYTQTLQDSFSDSSLCLVLPSGLCEANMHSLNSSRLVRVDRLATGTDS